MMQQGELREQRFHTGTVELNYAEGPVSGEALLYLHGGDGRWQEGRALLEELACAFQVDGLDLRGHGLSGRVPGAYRLQDYVPRCGDLSGAGGGQADRRHWPFHGGGMWESCSRRAILASCEHSLWGILRPCQGMSSQRMLASATMHSEP